MKLEKEIMNNSQPVDHPEVGGFYMVGGGGLIYPVSTDQWVAHFAEVAERVKSFKDLCEQNLDMAALAEGSITSDQFATRYGKCNHGMKWFYYDPRYLYIGDGINK